jgi:predicted transcriptional regulator
MFSASSPRPTSWRENKETVFAVAGPSRESCGGRREADTMRTDPTTARDVMTRPAITVVAYTSAAGAAQLMHEVGVHGLPVVDNANRLVGIVTQTDLVRAFNRPDEAIAQEIRDELRWQLPDLRAADGERPTVDVKGGAVVLRGRLERRSDIDTLEHVVRRAPGVVSLSLDVTWKIDDRDVSQAAR